MPGLRHQFYLSTLVLGAAPLAALALWEVHTDLPYPILPAKPF